MAHYYKILHQEDVKREEGQIKQTTYFFLYPHQTHWIYEKADLEKDRVAVLYCRAECRHDPEYQMAWKNSTKFDGPPTDSDIDSDSDSASIEDVTPNNDD